MIRLFLCAAVYLASFFSPAVNAGTLSFPNTPLTATSEPPPNVVLVLSVEFPTVGAAYNGANNGLVANEDQWFNPANTYLGYFDPNKCYAYSVDNPTSANAGYFYPVGKVINTDRHCNTTSTPANQTRWSGNFLNWALTSAIDILRQNLTGGYRISDTETFTVLARARLDSNIVNSRNHYFPTRRVGTGSGIDTTSGRVATDARLIAGVTSDLTRQLRIIAYENHVEVEDLNSSGNVLSRRHMNPRVQVCVPNVSGLSLAESLESNCTRYGNNYKPEGNIQRYSASMRFAAFGYVIDNQNSRQGGVLRAPMKSTGPQAWVSGSFITNPAVEWNPSTGVFIANPDSASEGNSGVVNYLNKFGLVSGYKVYDNVGELYSEAIRYLMGKQPLNSSISGITTSMKDGFPVYTTWADPILGYCQKNHVIVIGDTNTWCDGSVPGGSEIATGTCGTGSVGPVDFDATYWTNQIGSRESMPSLATTATGATGGRFLMSGIAYFANTQNLRPDLSSDPSRKVTARTYAIDVGEPSSHVLNRRQYWFAAKYGGFVDSNGNGQPDPGEWEAPGVSITVAGTTFSPVPRTFFFAGNPQRLIEGLNEIFQTIASTVGGTGTTATTSNRIATNTGVFSVVTNPDDWTGDVVKYNVSVVRSGSSTSLSVSSTPAWSAAEKLTGKTTPTVVPPAISPSERNLWTIINGVPTNNFSSLNPDLLSFFNLNVLMVPPTADGFGAQRINWLRGVRTDEAPAPANLAPRKSLLADPGRSGALFVGPPNQGIPDPTYSNYARTNANRPGLVFVGTSLGMLHAFRETDGVEAFAYLPRALWERARRATMRGVGREPGLDAVPSVGDANFGSTTMPDWRTLVVGGFGAGARGIYLVDATNPNNVRPLWEFTPESPGIDPLDAADLGHITGSIRIAKMPSGDWVAIFGNGYNSPNSRSALFVVKLNNTSGTWSRNVNYWKYAATSVPSSPATAPANGLGPVGLASLDAVGTVEYVYAGDLLGRMFRFDFSTFTTMPASRETPSSAPFRPGPFTLIDTGRPITAAPKVAFHPHGGVQVLFGTGKLLEQSDRAGPFAQQYVYGIWDKNRTTPVSNVVTGSPPPLAPRTLTTTGTRRTVSGPAVDYANNQAGWRLELSSTGGERVIADPDLEFGKFTFITVSTGGAVCAEGGSWLYNLDPITGLAPGRSFDTNNDGRIDASDDVIAGVALGATSYGSPTSLRIARAPSDPIGQVSYFTLLPDGSRPPGGAGFKATLGHSTGASGRINFRQLSR
ncbi:MAG: PilC/PilY family type IV pilus protein [Burkholderiales bacterium]|nr:PilC/PilY family type IV pilus protein [Burkholderiales bacterium]